MRVRLQDIADHVGVHKATVSVTLNGSPNAKRVGQKTRDRIMETARKMGYRPNAAAKALANRKTGVIGFVISDAMDGGFSNGYVASQLSGLEREVARRGYSLHVSLYNLSNIDSFVFPEKVGQRSVDGLILTGHVAKSVVGRFVEFGVPCVCIGDNMETAQLVPSVATDAVGGYTQALERLWQEGHKNVAINVDPFPRPREVAEQAVRQISKTVGREFRVQLIDVGHAETESQLAQRVLDQCVSGPANKKPTAIIASDRVLLFMLQHMAVAGLRCPDDLSMISSTETMLCAMATPPLTAIDQQLPRLGQLAADWLINHLEDECSLDTEKSKKFQKTHLIIRDSCKRID